MSGKFFVRPKKKIHTEENVPAENVHHSAYICDDFIVAHQNSQQENSPFCGFECQGKLQIRFANVCVFSSSVFCQNLARYVKRHMRKIGGSGGRNKENKFNKNINFSDASAPILSICVFAFVVQYTPVIIILYSISHSVA